MLLHSLNLKNFRQFESLDIDFDSQLTVLVGPNGSGKSAVLDAVSVALGTFFIALDIPTKTIAKSDARVTSRHLSGRGEVRSVYPVAISANGSVFDREVRWRRTLNSAGGSTTRVYAKEMARISQMVREMLAGNAASELRHDAPLPLISYYGTGRLWSQKNAPRSGAFDPTRREEGYQGCLDASADEKRFLKWMEKMDYAEYKGESIPEYHAICNTLAQLYESVSDCRDVRVTYDRLQGDLVLTYLYGGDTIKLPMRNMSDGYSTVLGMIGDMAYRTCELNPQLGSDAPRATSGVVLIDEVDLHLHPKWQTRVLRDLRKLFPRVQFIVTTHAPSVISSVDRKHIRILDGEASAYTPASQTYGRDASSIFREVMDAPERQSEVSERFAYIYDALDTENVAAAREAIENLESMIGSNDHELTAVRTTLSILEME